MENRLKNYGLWTSVAALLLMILQNSGVQVLPEQWDLYVNSALSILILLGIISNPDTENTGFKDDRAP
jgi:uncharacterized membrane protein